MVNQSYGKRSPSFNSYIQDLVLYFNYINIDIEEKITFRKVH